DNFGNAYFQMNQHNGVRCSASNAFLEPIRSRPNLKILTNAQVRRIEIEHRRATGVEVNIDGQAVEIFQANREVVLAAGSIGSPQILQLSGVGPGALLQSHGIEVNHELPGVGENLHDHLQVRSVYKVENTVTLNQRANSLIGRMVMGIEYLLYKTGPLTMPPSQLGAFAKTDPSLPSANIEWHVQPLSLDKFGDPLHSFNAITPSVCNLQPSSRGHVRINSANPETYPTIKLNYLASEEDRAVAILGIRFTRRIMAADALAKYRPREWKPGVDLDSDEDLARAAGDLGTTIFHPVGTCKMGNDPMAVVNDRLAVHGMEGLRVIDASIMPRITSGNTNAPTVMIAEKGAEFIRLGAR
ncbi:MAG: GMC oxidoreductase, partial [Gammaproteobacteria bacterium]|nr:GMC oxidoreductase [Gammaproteobacteria bacterium]